MRGRNSFLEIGRELTRLKELVPHGQFQDICRQELDGMAPQTARNYMNVWVRFGHQPDTLSLFTQTGIYTLAAATIPEPVVEQIVEKAQEQVAADWHAPDPAGSQDRTEPTQAGQAQ